MQLDPDVQQPLKRGDPQRNASADAAEPSFKPSAGTLEATTQRLSRLFRHAAADPLMLALFRAMLEYRTGQGK